MDFFPTIVLPALIFLAIGGALGFGLAFLHERFKIARDHKVDEILRLLPGANCGGCGSGGCEAFAQKLAKGEADVASCVPCSDEYAKEIEKLPGLRPEKNGNAAAPVRRAKKAYEVHPESCGACCRCASECRFQAIEISCGHAEIDCGKCLGCGKCVNVCPNKCITEKESPT